MLPRCYFASSVMVVIASGGALAQPVVTRQLRPTGCEADPARGVYCEVRDLPIEEKGAVAPGVAIAPAVWTGEVAWCFVRVAGTQHNRGSPEVAALATDGEFTVTVPVHTPGSAMIGIDWNPAEMRWRADVAARYLTPIERAAFEARGRTPENTMDHAPDHTPDTVPVTLYQSSAAMVRVSQNAEAVTDATPTSKAGLQAEIRPLMDPTTMALGSDMPVRVYAWGDASPGATLIATHEATGERTEKTADAKGIAHLRLDRSGMWRVTSTTVRYAPESLDAPSKPVVLRAAAACLTFCVPESAPHAPVAPEKARTP